MVHGKTIEVTQEQIDEFFKGMRQMGTPIREYTEFDKKIIITAYEKGYNKEETARKLRTNTKRMKRFWIDYCKSKELGI